MSTLSHCPSSFYSDGLDGDLPQASSLAQRVVPCDVYKPNQLSSFNGRQEGFLLANTCCCIVPDVHVDVMVCLEDAEQSSQTLVFKCLYLTFCVSVNVQPNSRAESTRDV